MSRNNRYPPSFWLIITANLFLSAGFQWTFATLPGYVQHIGGDAAQLGLAFALLSLTALAARPGVGWLVDRWGRKPVLLTGALIFSLSPLLYAWSSSLWPFMAVRVLHGVSIAAFSTAYLTIVGDLAPAARRGEAVGLSGVTSNLAMLFAPALGAYVATAWGYAALLVAGAIFGSGWGLARAGLDTSVVEAVTAEVRGSAVGILYASFDIGVGAGSFGLGLVAQAWSYAAAFYAAASWAVVALAGYLGWGRPKRRANAPPIPADIPDP
jgi:MFS family permease